MYGPQWIHSHTAIQINTPLLYKLALIQVNSFTLTRIWADCTHLFIVSNLPPTQTNVLFQQQHKELSHKGVDYKGSTEATS